MKIRLTNPANFLIVLIMVAAMALIFSCSDGGSSGCTGDDCVIGGGGNSSSSGGVNTGSGSSSSRNNNGGGGSSSSFVLELCKHNGQNAHCQWAHGCYAVSNEDDPCPKAISDCKSYGQLYTGVSLPGGADFAEGEKCENYGGDFIEGVEFCANYQDKQFYCQWSDGCYAISGDCEDEIWNCRNYGEVFVAVDPLAAGKGKRCADNGGKEFHCCRVFTGISYDSSWLEAPCGGDSSPVDYSYCQK